MLIGLVGYMKNDIFMILNKILIHAKYFIFRKKQEKGEIPLFAFLLHLSGTIKEEKYKMTEKTFKKAWGIIENDICSM